MKRVFLFLLTNLAVMLVLGVVLSIIMSALGLSHRSLGGILLIATVFGFGGSFISLFMSKWIAKKSTGAQVITQPRTETEQWLVYRFRPRAPGPNQIHSAVRNETPGSNAVPSPKRSCISLTTLFGATTSVDPQLWRVLLRTSEAISLQMLSRWKACLLNMRS